MGSVGGGPVADGLRGGAALATPAASFHSPLLKAPGRWWIDRAQRQSRTSASLPTPATVLGRNKSPCRKVAFPDASCVRGGDNGPSVQALRILRLLAPALSLSVKLRAGSRRVLRWGPLSEATGCPVPVLNPRPALLKRGSCLLALWSPISRPAWPAPSRSGPAVRGTRLRCPQATWPGRELQPTTPPRPPPRPCRFPPERPVPC